MITTINRTILTRSLITVAQHQPSNIEAGSLARQHIYIATKYECHRIPIPHLQFKGAIIGRQGENIGNVQRKFPEIFIFFDNGDICVHGPVPNVREAKELLIKKMSKFKCCEVELPNVTVYMVLIGKGGCNISKVQKRFPEVRNLNIVHKDNDRLPKIVLFGPTLKVKEMEQELIDEIDKLEYCEIQLENDRFKAVVIGKGGKNIATIRDNFPDVKIDMCDREGHYKICLCGQTEQLVQQAKQVLLDEIAKFKSSEIRLQNNTIKVALIGKGGEKIQKMNKEIPEVYNTYVEGVGGEIIMTLFGPVLNVIKFEKQLRDVIDKLEYSEVLLERLEFALRLLKNNGENIDATREKFPGAVINITYTEEQYKVCICGEPAQIQELRQLLQDEVANMEYREVHVGNEAFGKSLLACDDIAKISHQFDDVHVQLLQNDGRHKISLCGSIQDVTEFEQHLLEQMQKSECVELAVITNARLRQKIMKLRHLYPEVCIGFEQNKVLIHGPAWLLQEVKTDLEYKLAHTFYLELPLKHHAMRIDLVKSVANSMYGTQKRFSNISVSFSSKKNNVSVWGATEQVVAMKRFLRTKMNQVS